MRRLRAIPPAAVRLLALLLLLQWGTAMAHCLRAAASAGIAVEICTAEGVRTVHLDERGDARGGPPPGHAACPFCAAGDVPEPGARLAPPVRVAYGAPVVRHPAGLPPSPPRAPPQQPRAPPIS